MATPTQASPSKITSQLVLRYAHSSTWRVNGTDILCSGCQINSTSRIVLEKGFGSNPKAKHDISPTKNPKSNIEERYFLSSNTDKKMDIQTYDD